ncbi:hypothetical protein HK405_012387 [Cladochytrium tenue]|nr:hypothetical protein HK405_012387 [Cladochytrium tenue]
MGTTAASPDGGDGVVPASAATPAAAPSALTPPPPLLSPPSLPTPHLPPGSASFPTAKSLQRPHAAHLPAPRPPVTPPLQPPGTHRPAHHRQPRNSSTTIHKYIPPQPASAAVRPLSTAPPPPLPPTQPRGSIVIDLPAPVPSPSPDRGLSIPHPLPRPSPPNPLLLRPPPAAASHATSTTHDRRRRDRLSAVSSASSSAAADAESEYWMRRVMRATKPTVRLLSLPLRYDAAPRYFDEIMPEELSGRISNVTFAVRMQELNRRLGSIAAVADLGPLLRLSAMLFAAASVVALFFVLTFDFADIWTFGLAAVLSNAAVLVAIALYKVKAVRVLAELTASWTKEDRPACRLRWRSLRAEAHQLAATRPVRVPWKIVVDLVAYDAAASDDTDGDGGFDTDDDDGADGTDAESLDAARAPPAWQLILGLDPASRSAALLQLIDQSIDPLPLYSERPTAPTLPRATPAPDSFWSATPA